jgi:hypothetical protein
MQQKPVINNHAYLGHFLLAFTSIAAYSNLSDRSRIDLKILPFKIGFRPVTGAIWYREIFEGFFQMVWKTSYQYSLHYKFADLP